MINDDRVDELLMTGGQATFDAIVWGSDVVANKRNNKQLVTKKFDAELGAVSPWIVCPGQWSQAEIEHQAEFLVAAKLLNASAVCASPQAVLVDAHWPQRRAFEAAVLRVARAHPDVPTFYNGTCARARALVDASAQLGANVAYSRASGVPALDRDAQVENFYVFIGKMNYTFFFRFY